MKLQTTAEMTVARESGVTKRELITATIMNAHVRDQLTALKTPASFLCIVDEASNYTTTSTSFTDVDATNLGATITTGGGIVLVGFTASLDASTAQVINVCLDVDGTQYPADDGFGGSSNDMLATGGLIGFTFPVLGLSAGSHTFKIQWKTSAGTATMYAGAATSNFDNHPTFWGIEKA